jgi:hypothetical protein
VRKEGLVGTAYNIKAIKAINLQMGIIKVAWQNDGMLGDDG